MHGRVLFRCSVLALSVAMSSDLYAKSTESIPFQISRQRADIGLIQFAQQADLTLIVPFDEIEEKMINQLVGEYSLEEAINLLLQGTGLEAKISDDSQLSIFEASPGGEDMHKKTKLSTAIMVALGSFLGGGQHVSANDSTMLEEIVVTGIRSALKNAVSIKREQNSIVDAVSAEDVGKFPDSDVGEALARIPGVTVGRAFGQGSSVSIRGGDPLMTLTTLNGQNVSSTGWYDQMNIDRSFNYSMLPPQLISGIDVYKSSQADIVEGGIGGTVIVKTRKPLDLDANTAFLSAKLSQGSVSEDKAPEVSGLYSWKNDNETFGVLLAASQLDREYVRRGTEADLDWGGRSSIQPSTFIQDQERTAIDFAAQYRPTEELEFGIHHLSLELGADSTGANMYINTDTDWGDGASNCQSFNAAGVCVVSNTPASDPSRVFFQNWLRTGEMTSETTEVDFKYESDNFAISGIAGSTKAEGGTGMTANFGFGWWGDRFGDYTWAGSVDATGNQISVNPVGNMDFTVDQLDSTASTSQWTGTRGPNSDEETYFQVDVDFDVDFGVINKIETGLRSTSHEFERQEFRAVYGNGANSFDTSTLYSGTMALGADGWSIPLANRDAMINATLSLVDEFVYSRPGYGKIEEDNTAAYVMFGFEGEGFRGNFGLRYISTDITSSGHQIDSNAAADSLAVNANWSVDPVSVGGSYDDVLPSINMIFDLNDNMLLRASAAQAIVRPNYDNLFLVSTSGFPDDRQGNEVLTYGNPNLKPMKSSQFDLSLEYYYGDGNLASITYFKKDISNFIVSVLDNDGEPLPVGTPNTDLDNDADLWTVERYQNANQGEIEGLEFQVNHSWDNGFGVVANYTYADGSAPASVFLDQTGVFTESSENSANLVGYWENHRFSARAAYNWRSEYMIREGAKYYGNRYHDDFGTLDLTFGYNYSDNLSVGLEIVNLLEEDDVQFGAANPNNPDVGVKPALQDSFPTWSFKGERTVKLGIDWTF